MLKFRLKLCDFNALLRIPVPLALAPAKVKSLRNVATVLTHCSCYPSAMAGAAGAHALRECLASTKDPIATLKEFRENNSLSPVHGK